MYLISTYFSFNNKNISRLRRQNYSVAALAFHGLFLKSDEDEGIAVSWDTSGVTGEFLRD